MLNLRAFPQKLAFLSAGLALAIVWGLGLLNDVPIYRISLRAIIAAGVFWTLGLIAGRIFLSSICESLSEHIHNSNEDSNTRSGGKA